jgi:hypothetical protein
MKPNRPVPVIQPTVVATALPNATSIKIVPWIRSSHRRNVAILEVDWGVVKRLAFIAIFSPPPNEMPLSRYQKKWNNPSSNLASAPAV